MVWFASIVAAALYAIGFAYFGLVLVRDLCQGLQGSAPAWLDSRLALKAVAAGTIALLAIILSVQTESSGKWVNLGKVLVFGTLILGGCGALLGQPLQTTGQALRPFFSDGTVGLVKAMGYTFIALQGFDLIAAVAGEVRAPSRNVPRAMVLSLVIALVIYIPLLFVITTVGVAPGESISALASRDPEGIIAVAAKRFLGSFGYWLVIVAAVLSMFSALQANLFAASRIARTMARDRTLPVALSVLSGTSRAPAAAIVVTASLATLILVALPDVAAAGAAASLIFLVTFALAHWISILVRQRSVRNPPPFRTPLYPVVPIIGGLACIALAGFEGFVVPSAGKIVVAWLGLGGVLFLALFARRARVTDASRTARDPELLTLRGQSPLVLVPIANPQNAQAMIALADSLVPGQVGRVLVQTVLVAPDDWQPGQDQTPLERSQVVLAEIVRASAVAGIRADVLTTVAAEPMTDIARVARLHRCESVLLGLSKITNHKHGSQLESLLGELDANVVILRSRDDWRLGDASRILVPVAGRGGHEHLLALLVGSLLRTANRQVTYLRVLPTGSRPDEIRRARRDLELLIDDDVSDRCHVDVKQSDDAVATVAELADQSDLLVLGVQRLHRHKKLFGTFTRQIAQRTDCPLIVMSRRG